MIFTCAEVTPAEMNRQLKEIYGENALSGVHVWKWCKRFDEGRTNNLDEERSGRPLIIFKELVDAVEETFENTNPIMKNTVFRQNCRIVGI